MKRKRRILLVQEGRKIPLCGRAAEVAERMVSEVSISPARCAPGLRLAAIIHSMRWKKAVRIRSTLRPNGTGDGYHAEYSFLDQVRIENA